MFNTSWGTFTDLGVTDGGEVIGVGGSDTGEDEDDEVGIEFASDIVENGGELFWDMIKALRTKVAVIFLCT